MCIGVRKIITIILFFSFAMMTKGQDSLSVAERNALQGFNDTIDRLAEDFIEAYVAVAEPGDYLYSVFGHAAYHLKCPAFDLDYYYTMESEDEPKVLPRLLAGDLKMGMFFFPANDFLAYYASENRGVTEWKMNLTPLQKQHLWAILDKHVKEWQGMPYDYYHHGCAITMVDMMSELVGRKNILYTEPWPTRLTGTARETGYVALKEHPWAQFCICLLVGNEIDKVIPSDRLLYVPADLAEIWKKATINGKPILDSKPIEILPAGIRKKRTGCTPLEVSWGLLLMALLSFGTLFTKATWLKQCGKIVDYTILGVVTLIGLFMTYLLFVSKLPCTEWNWLYIAFNPLPAIGWYWRKYWALPYAGIMLGWVIAMICVPHLLALWPHIVIVCALIVVLVKEYLKNSLKIQK